MFTVPRIKFRDLMLNVTFYDRLISFAFSDLDLKNYC